MEKGGWAVKKTVENWDWNIDPVKLDPRLGLLLCQSCWQGQHNTKNEDFHCRKNGCQCACIEIMHQRRIKRTKSEPLPFPEEPIYVGPNAEFVKAQVEALKR
jgi:hypothetical protein